MTTYGDLSGYGSLRSKAEELRERALRDLRERVSLNHGLEDRQLLERLFRTEQTILTFLIIFAGRWTST